MIRCIVFVSLLLVPFNLCAQQPAQPCNDCGELLKTQLPSAPFPHPRRDGGYSYGMQFYPKEKHYNDSSVAMFIPKGFRPSASVDLVIHIHGWRNTIDSALARYHLPQQLSDSGKNAILVLPEGPRNAPDYFWGKLEEPGGFGKFVEEVADYLFRAGKIPTPNVGNVILSGHSGAYHAIAYALMQGGLADKIREVYLFDALYGQKDKFSDWVDSSQGKLVVVFTDTGGTKEVTQSLMKDLRARKTPFYACDEIALSPSDLANNRVLFLHTDLEHDKVLHSRQEFRDYLEASCLSNR